MTTRRLAAPAAAPATRLISLDVFRGRTIAAMVIVIAPLAMPTNAPLLYAFANLGILFALLAWMYRRGVFLRV